MKKRKEIKVPRNDKALSNRCMPAKSKLPQSVYIRNEDGTKARDKDGKLRTAEIGVLANRKKRRSMAYSHKHFKVALVNATIAKKKEDDETARAILAQMKADKKAKKKTKKTKKDEILDGVIETETETDGN